MYSDLQIDLESLHKCNLDWAMDFNKNKCQVLRIWRKKAKRASGHYILGGKLRSRMCFTY